MPNSLSLAISSRMSLRSISRPGAAGRSGRNRRLADGAALSRFRVTGQRKRWMVLSRDEVRGGADGGAEHGGCGGGEPGAIAGVSRPPLGGGKQPGGGL